MRPFAVLIYACGLYVYMQFELLATSCPTYITFQIAVVPLSFCRGLSIFCNEFKF